MDVEYTNNGHRKITYDKFNQRLYKEEWACIKCAKWTITDEVIWATSNGKLSVKDGAPYCDNCLPEEEVNMESPIGYFYCAPNDKSFRVICCVCKENSLFSVGSPVYSVNIGDYSQDCCQCGKLLVKGKTAQWPILFDGR